MKQTYRFQPIDIRTIILPANSFTGCLVEKITFAPHLDLTIVTNVGQHAKVGWHQGFDSGGIELKRLDPHEQKIGVSRLTLGRTWIAFERGGLRCRLRRIAGRNSRFQRPTKSCFER
ncbi:hypothetical protein A8M32_00210 [Sinorhizobium alkalisoli]|uniref:Uncharacterized protein n=1 Tax=Sinorhizobium alkalisoli TaxID=1752398 RepID=A0A1E3VIE7_9HYPH|nr:hypothetical protein A8M32_00210 [Sinorhizobium alkalisoli]